MNASDNTTKELSKSLKSLETSFIISVLKYATDEEHPLSAKEIAIRMVRLTNELHDEKTILRKLRSICTLTENEAEETEPACRAFALTYGGYIRSITTTIDGTSKKPQYKFYFEPFLLPSDISMIYSILACNRYLPPHEKEHLLSTLQVLAPEKRIINEDISSQLPTEPTRHVPKKGQVKYIDLLNTVKILYEAIQNKKRITVVYGNYTMDETQFRRITFENKKQTKPNILNPYALFWNNGFYYLLATHWNYPNPAVFRVDRIVSAEYYQNSKKPERMERAPIPETLKKYYKNPGTDAEYFDAERYTAVHPLMTYAQTEHLIECCLECNTSTLGLLVDTFGSVEILGNHIQILESNIAHPEEVDVNGCPIPYFTVRIPQVQYENIRAFCIQNHHLITVISPLELILETVEAIGQSAVKYAKLLPPLLEGKDEEVNPFVTSGNTLLKMLSSMNN